MYYLHTGRETYGHSSITHQWSARVVIMILTKFIANGCRPLLCVMVESIAPILESDCERQRLLVYGGGWFVIGEGGTSDRLDLQFRIDK